MCVELHLQSQEESQMPNLETQIFSQGQHNDAVGSAAVSQLQQPRFESGLWYCWNLHVVGSTACVSPGCFCHCGWLVKESEAVNKHVLENKGYIETAGISSKAEVTCTRGMGCT